MTTATDGRVFREEGAYWGCVIESVPGLECVEEIGGIERPDT